MKKTIRLFLLIFIFFLAINVNATVDIKSDEYFGIYPNDDGNVNNMYISSGKSMSLDLHASSEKIVFYDVVGLDEKSNNIKVSLNTSGGVNCNLNNVANNYYTFSNNTYTLNNIETSFEEAFGFNIGQITCNFPTTNSFTKLSNNMSLTVNIQYTDVDLAFNPPAETAKNKKYIFRFGVINENYYNSLNNSTSISSITINGKPYEEMKVNDITEDTLKVKINQNGLASKNRLHIEFGSDSATIIDENLSKNEKNISMPYGLYYLSISEETEKEIFLNETIHSEDYTSFIGFPDGFFDYASFDSDHDFVFNRIDTRSKVNTLKSLSISDVSINFKPELKNYIATVPYSVSSVKIYSKLTDSKSNYVDGFGNRTVQLNEGNNDVQIKVRAENGSETTYSIKITREKNNDSTLKSIKVDDDEISIKKGKLRYSLNVDNKVTKPKITATPNDSNAKIEIDNFEELKEGDNEINIIVTASNGMKSNYVVNIIRDKLISSNSKLKNIVIKNHELKFDRDKLNYKIKLSKDEDKLDIAVETANNKAKYLIIGNKELKNNSIVKIKVTAEDGKTTTIYTIEIEKEVKNNNILIIIPIIVILIIVIIFIIMNVKKTNNKDEAKDEKVDNNNQLNEIKTSENDIQLDNIPTDANTQVNVVPTNANTQVDNINTSDNSIESDTDII